MAGYSKTPLAKKLGLKPELTIFLHNHPSHYFDLLQFTPADLTLVEDFESEKEIDFAHLFFHRREEMEDLLPLVKASLKKNGMIWISWPKSKSKIPTNLNGQIVRETGLAIGLVDTKVCAVDEDWSGHKFVFRLKDR